MQVSTHHGPTSKPTPAAPVFISWSRTGNSRNSNRHDESTPDATPSPVPIAAKGTKGEAGPATTILEGAVHLVLFFVYIVLIFSP
jgi:hypothetical protein